MRTDRSQEGYLLIENRFAPGPSAEDLHRWGKDAPVVPQGATYESATYTCSHCHSVVVLNPNRSRPRNWCSRCAHRVCDSPACNKDCLPLRAVFEDLQNAIYHNPEAPLIELTDHPLVTLT